MDFAKWLNIQEMANFTVPDEADFKMPCNKKEKDFGCKVGMIDMRFEDNPKTLDDNEKVLNNGSYFIAKIPMMNNLGGTGQYLVYSGMKDNPRLENNPLTLKKLQEPRQEKWLDGVKTVRHIMLPDNWWEKALMLDDEYDQIQKARGDFDGSRWSSAAMKDQA